MSALPAILLVCGFGRCGSSLVMQMLEAGGHPVTGEFPAFEDDIGLMDNGFGEIVSALPFAGKAVKLLNPQLFTFTPDIRFRAIWLDRNGTEQARSQAKFMQVMMGLMLTRRDTKALATSYKQDCHLALAKLKHVCEHVTRLTFEEIIRQPLMAAGKLNAASGIALDVAAMARVVKPRSPACYPGMLELELLREREGA